MANRHGLCLLYTVKPAVGASDSAVAVAQMQELQERDFEPKSVRADKAYHNEKFVTGLRLRGVGPHPAIHPC